MFSYGYIHLRNYIFIACTIFSVRSRKAGICLDGKQHRIDIARLGCDNAYGITNITFDSTCSLRGHACGDVLLSDAVSHRECWTKSWQTDAMERIHNSSKCEPAGICDSYFDYGHGPWSDPLGNFGCYGVSHSGLSIKELDTCTLDFVWIYYRCYTLQDSVAAWTPFLKYGALPVFLAAIFFASLMIITTRLRSFSKKMRTLQKTVELHAESQTKSPSPERRVHHRHETTVFSHHSISDSTTFDRSGESDNSFDFDSRGDVHGNVRAYNSHEEAGIGDLNVPIPATVESVEVYELEKHLYENTDTINKLQKLYVNSLHKSVPRIDKL